jgi:hypothetical protein
MDMDKRIMWFTKIDRHGSVLSLLYGVGRFTPMTKGLVSVPLVLANI